jgi:processive 1,2-diacylglycerol beta-glucosyltransferase
LSGSARDGCVLVLSAPVGEGHDAAGQALVDELRSAGQCAEMTDGLTILGPRLTRVVVRGYRLQLRHAVWSWAVLYALTRSRFVLRVIGFAIALYGGGRLLDEIHARGADRVVSTYPLVSAALASLRRRGKLTVACASLITDFDPHPAWCHPDLDTNLSVVAGPHATSVAPPLRPRDGSAPDRQTVRHDLGIAPAMRVVIISGGAWGVGSLRAAAATVASLPGFHAIVVTGRNEPLRRQLAEELRGRAATVLGYVDGLAGFLPVADVVVQHAGGVTCLEAFAASRPVVMFDPLPGHGRRNARRMQAAGLSATAATSAALRSLLMSPGYWATVAPASVAAGLALFSRTTAGGAVAAIEMRAPKASRYRPVRPKGVARAATVAGLCAALLLARALGAHLSDPDVAFLLV